MSQFDKPDDKFDIKLKKESTPPMTEDEVLSFLKTTLIIPHIFLGKLPARTDEQLRPFAKELCNYCRKKNIDIASYLFDEFGLVVTAAALIGGYVTDYRKYYGKNAANMPTAEDKKLSADFDHQKKIDEQYNSDGTLKV